MPLSQGMIQVYTGDGKGKTTAALGLALRAVGRGLRVCMVQFMKGAGGYGEHTAAESLAPSMTLLVTGTGGWVKKGALSEEDLSEAERGLNLARWALWGEDFDLVILDEFNGAVDFGLIPLEQALELMAEKPPRVELVLTGRNAHPQVLERADLVSEVKAVKHYFERGVEFREGIEC